MSSIKFSNEQRRTIQRAASLIDAACNALDDVHSELCDRLQNCSPSKAIDAHAATSEVYRVACIAHDTMRSVEHLAARPKRRRKRAKTSAKKWLTHYEMKVRDGEIDP